jgi:hypothetical protein
LTTFRLVRGPLDRKPLPQKFSDSHDPGSSWLTLPHLFTYSLIRHLMPPLSSTWIQRHRRGCSATGVGAAPASNHAFLLPIPGWAVKKAATIHTTSGTVLLSTPSRLTIRYTLRLGFLGLGLIRSSTTLVAMTRPGLDHCRSTKE